MGFVERHRSEIIVLIVLPISLVIWCVRKLQRWWQRPRPELHRARVARVAAAVRARAAGSGAEPLRTDRSIYDSHSVRNSDKAGATQVSMRDLYAILGLADDGRTLHVEPGATVGEVQRPGYYRASSSWNAHWKWRMPPLVALQWRLA